jgi:recombination protein RecA
MENKSTNAFESGATTQKNKAIELAVQAIEKQFGKGSIMRLGNAETLVAQDTPSVPTGSLSLDIALGIGGLPRGRIVEIYGPEASGKTTLTLHAIAEVQKQGGVAAFIDAEHALDVNYARKLGVRTDDLLISQPDTGEQALEIADMLVRSGGIDLLVVDSVAALVPRAEIEGEMGDSHMGLQARLMSQALRKLTGSINRSKTLLIFINQIRMKIGVMFGNPETTTGGNALKFYSSVRLDIRRIQAIKDGENVIGNRTRVKVVKNKMAPPFKEVEFDIIYGEGISKEGDLLDLAANMNIIEKSGTWYSYKDERIGQGRDASRTFLKERPEMIKTIREEVLRKSGIGVSPNATAANATAAIADAKAAHAAALAQTASTQGSGAVQAGPAKSTASVLAAAEAAAKAKAPQNPAHKPGASAKK